MVAWKGYDPGSPEAIAAAERYVAPAGVIEEGYVTREPLARPGGQHGEVLNGISAGLETEDPPSNVYVSIYQPTPAPAVVTTPTVFNGAAATLPGVEEDAIATPTAFPIAPIIAGAGMLSFGFLKRFFFRYGAKALKLLIGVAAFKEFMDLLGLGAPDDYMIKIRKNGKRRYSIGSNPRVGTLQKVSRHCQRLLKRHEKVIREFLPKRAPRYGIPPAKALSAIEKAAIRGT